MLKTHALTTIESALDALGLDASEAGTIERLINVASAAISRALGFEPYRATVEEDCVGRNAPTLLLSRCPVSSIEWVAEIDTGTGGTLEAVSASGYRIFDGEAGMLRRLDDVWTASYAEAGGILGLPVEGSQEPNWRVRYAGGWITPWQAHPAYPGGSLGTANLPDDLEEACLETVRARYWAQSRDPFIASQKLGDEAVTYHAPSTMGSESDLPTSVRAIIDRYRVDA